MNPPESPISGDKRAHFYSEYPYEQSIHQCVSVPNGVYEVTAWVKAYNAPIQIGRLEITGYGGREIYQNMSEVDTNWQRLVVPNVDVQNNSIDIGFYAKSGGGTTVLIDDVRLKSTDRID